MPLFKATSLCLLSCAAHCFLQAGSCPALPQLLCTPACPRKGQYACLVYTPLLLCLHKGEGRRLAWHTHRWPIPTPGHPEKLTHWVLCAHDLQSTMCYSGRWRCSHHGCPPSLNAKMSLLLTLGAPGLKPMLRALQTWSLVDMLHFH